MSSYGPRSFLAWRLVATAILVTILLADSARAAPPVRPIRPPVRVPLPESTPIRPSSPSVRSGAVPEEAMRGPSSFRPLPIVPFRGRPGDDDRSAAGSQDGSSGSSSLWWLLLIVPIAGGLVVLLVVMLLIDAVAKRRRSAAGSPPPTADSGRSHINPRWSPSGGK